MTSRLLLLTLLSSASLVSAVHAEDEVRADLAESNPAPDPTLAAKPATCDLKQANRWSKASQAAVDLEPEKYTDRCPEIAAYAVAASSVANAKKLPQPCSAFASLVQDRQQVAQYNWAYGSVIELLKEKNRVDRAERIGKALTLYNSQFAEYDTKLTEFSALCERVHSTELQASATDVTTWAQSGRLMRQSVKTRRSAVWDKRGVKSSLDGSFKSVGKMLK